MSRFTGPLSVVYAGDRFAALCEPLVWDCDEEGSGLTVTVPSGYYSDGVSIPRILWWFMPPWGDIATRAAILHDYLLEMIQRGTPVAGIDTRAKADRQFYLALKALKVKELRARLCYWGVSAYSTVLGIMALITPASVSSSGT